MKEANSESYNFHVSPLDELKFLYYMVAAGEYFIGQKEEVLNDLRPRMQMEAPIFLLAMTVCEHVMHQN